MGGYSLAIGITFVNAYIFSMFGYVQTEDVYVQLCYD